MFKVTEIIDIIQAIAAELVVNECFIEKDWYAMRIIGVLSQIQDSEMQLVFSGGTSLSKGFGLIQRFSEDLDFKVQVTGDLPLSRNQKRAFRDKVLETLEQHSTDYQVDRNALQKGNGSSFFKVPIHYKPLFEVSDTLRPHVQLEVTFAPPALQPESKPLQSFVRQALKKDPEVIAFPCISPIETAADKLSALVWRIQTRDRNSEEDDPTLIRHLHDLAALANWVQQSSDFPRLISSCLEKDKNRGKTNTTITQPQEAINFLIHAFKTDTLYQQEYEQFVEGMSYAKDSEKLSFADTLEILKSFTLLF